MVTGLLLLVEWLIGAVMGLIALVLLCIGGAILIGGLIGKSNEQKCAGAALLATAVGVGLTACGLLFEVGAFFG